VLDVCDHRHSRKLPSSHIELAHAAATNLHGLTK